MRRLIIAVLLLFVSTAVYAAGDPLPSGYLSVSGNQIVSGAGANVRLACVGYNEPTGNYASDMSIIRSLGFNCVRYPYYDKSLNLTTMDAIVSAATAANVRVIFDHHGNENDSACLGQQSNGLWYDLNGGTANNSNNTDGCGATGTITYATFKQNWVNIATHYNNNPTVIGFDLDNEPFIQGSQTAAPISWGASTNPGVDMQAMCQDVGTAIHTANAGALIICEGLINYQATMASGANNTVHGLTDLSGVQAHPVNITGKVVYSAHDYPQSISGVTPDSGATRIAANNVAWGYLVTNNIAPVFVGEMGASLDNTNGQLADEQGWASMLTNYVNGLSGGSGGPVFSGTQQPISTDWWTFGYLPGQTPDGILNADNTAKAGQQTYWSTLLYHSSSSAQQTTWNPSDASGVTLSGSNLVATSTVAGAGVRTTTGKSSGKFCIAVTETTISNHLAIAVASSTESLTGGPGGPGGSSVAIYGDFGGEQIYSNGAVVASNSTIPNLTNGDTVTVVVDATNKLVWFSTPEMVAAGAGWNHSSTASPTNGTGGISISFITAPYYVLLSTQDTGAVGTLVTSPTSCPAGIPTWDSVVASGGRPITVILGQNSAKSLLLPYSIGFSLN